MIYANVGVTLLLDVGDRIYAAIKNWSLGTAGEYRFVTDDLGILSLKMNKLGRTVINGCKFQLDHPSTVACKRFCHPFVQDVRHP